MCARREKPSKSLAFNTGRSLSLGLNWASLKLMEQQLGVQDHKQRGRSWPMTGGGDTGSGWIALYHCFQLQGQAGSSGARMSDEFEVTAWQEKKVLTKAGSCKGSKSEHRNVFISNREAILLTLHCISWAERLAAEDSPGMLEGSLVEDMERGNLPS